MMIAIISDVHGNYPALQAILKDIDSRNCKTIVSLGDVTGYYCMINECIEEFRRRRIVNLMGNHDSYLLGRGQCPRSRTVNQCIEYQKRIITKNNLEYLANSPKQIENSLFSARHGGWTNPLDEYIEEFDFNWVKDSKAKLFCSGHTHVQLIQRCGDKIYFNPGAVGQPRDGDPKAAYAMIENGSVSLYRVEYPIDAVIEKMRSAGFEDRISECLYLGTKVRTFGESGKHNNEDSF